MIKALPTQDQREHKSLLLFSPTLTLFVHKTTLSLQYYSCHSRITLVMYSPDEPLFNIPVPEATHRGQYRHRVALPRKQGDKKISKFYVSYLIWPDPLLQDRLVPMSGYRGGWCRVETSSPGNCCLLRCDGALATLPSLAAQEKDKDIGNVCRPRKRGGKEERKEKYGVVCFTVLYCWRSPPAQPLVFWFFFLPF